MTPRRKSGSADPGPGLADVRALRTEPDDAVVIARLTGSLVHPNAAVVAMAADLAAERELAALAPALAGALARLYENATETDPTCAGKIACATALDTLNHADKSPFVRGAFHIQIQPSWPTPEEVASGLRVRCVLALARFGGLDVLMVLAEALADRNEAVRSAAAQSLAYCGEPAAAAMAMQKIRSGDADPAVTADALGALLTLRPDDGLACARKLLDTPEASLRAFVCLTLGQSRLAGALPILTEQWSRQRTPGDRRDVVAAVGLLRTPNASEFLLDLVKNGDPHDARAAIAALATQSQTDTMRQAVSTAAAGRGLDAAIREAFA